MAGCQGRATFGKQTWPGGRAATLRVRWQINCEPCADGLIHLSSRYKRLSRSNFILRFWLSHPDSFQLLLPPPLCTHPSPTMESISVRRLFLSLSSTLARFSLSRSRLRPLPSPPLSSPENCTAKLPKTAYRILRSVVFFGRGERYLGKEVAGRDV